MSTRTISPEERARIAATYGAAHVPEVVTVLPTRNLTADMTDAQVRLAAGFGMATGITHKPTTPEWLLERSRISGRNSAVRASKARDDFRATWDLLHGDIDAVAARTGMPRRGVVDWAVRIGLMESVGLTQARERAARNAEVLEWLDANACQYRTRTEAITAAAEKFGVGRWGLHKIWLTGRKAKERAI